MIMHILLQNLPDIALITWLIMSMVFIFAVIRKDNSIVDSFWGIGFVVIALYALLQSGEIDLRKAIVTLLVIIWGFRLSLHIIYRNRDKGEDFRYKAWRDSWKYFYLRSYLQIFLLQGFLMIIISTPVWFIGFNSGKPLGGWDFLGLVLFGAGFLIETTADNQLAQFKKDTSNKGKLLTTGLWSISRHPNYFGEAVLWWGIGCYALSFTDGWLTLVGPLVITLLLRYVSGVPMLEKHFENHPMWSDYKAKTPPFIPFIRW